MIFLFQHLSTRQGPPQSVILLNRASCVLVPTLRQTFPSYLHILPFSLFSVKGWSEWGDSSRCIKTVYIYLSCGVFSPKVQALLCLCERSSLKLYHLSPLRRPNHLSQSVLPAPYQCLLTQLPDNKENEAARLQARFWML